MPLPNLRASRPRALTTGHGKGGEGVEVGVNGSGGCSERTELVALPVDLHVTVQLRNLPNRTTCGLKCPPRSSARKSLGSRRPAASWHPAKRGRVASQPDRGKHRCTSRGTDVSRFAHCPIVGFQHRRHRHYRFLCRLCRPAGRLAAPSRTARAPGRSATGAAAARAARGRRPAPGPARQVQTVRCRPPAPGTCCTRARPPRSRKYRPRRPTCAPAPVWPPSGWPSPLG